MSNRNYKEYHDEIMKEFEMDKESADYKIPDEWDQRFRKIIEDTITVSYTHLTLPTNPAV